MGRDPLSLLTVTEPAPRGGWPESERVPRAPRPVAPNPLSPVVQQIVATAGVALFAAALLIGINGAHNDEDYIRAVGEALCIGVPIAVGLFALQRDGSDRFARLLVIAGFVWAPVMLALSDASVPYSIGRIFGWIQEAVLIYLLLALPLGRLTGRVDRFLAVGAALLVAILFMPLTLFAPFPDPSPWSSCVTGCPHNAFMITGSESVFVSHLIGLRGVLTVIAYFAATIVLARRIARDRRVLRVYGPALILAIAHVATSGVFNLVRAKAPGAEITQIMGLAALLTIPGMILAFFAGLLHWRFVARNTWAQIPEAPAAATAERIRELVADALDDPSLEVGYWDAAEQRWIDSDGYAFALPARRSRRCCTEITSQGRPVAIFVHEDTSLAGPTIRDIVRGLALLALENQRLEAGMRASMRALRESRARIMAAVDTDRLRIERDLHDGAQQRLIALKVAAELGADAVDGEPERAAQLFRRIGDDAGRALEEVRSLARGVYPPLLIDFGLVAALNDAAARASLPAVVRARGLGRYPPEIEAAVYFCCLEALQNAEKHSAARSVTITLIADRELSFEVRDNGRGFAADELFGAGLSNMRDRTAAVDGKLRVDSIVGEGTRVAGSVPLAPDHLPPEIERLVLTATEAIAGAMGIYKAVRGAGGRVVDFAVEHVNEAACRLSGMSRGAQVGRTLSQLDASYSRSDAFRWHCEALEAGETLEREEYEYSWTAAGRRIQAAYAVKAIPLGAGRLVLAWHDVTEQKRAERVRDLRARAVAQEADGVCIVRASTGAIAYANERFERMLGYESGELEGRDSGELEWYDPGAGSARDEAPRVMRCRRRDGSAVWCELTVSGFDDPDLGWCWVSVHRDVTSEREEYELALLRSERLGEALRGLALLAYTADPDLRCTLLFDNLIDPVGTEGPRSGPDLELFGPLLADHIAALNRRVLVSGHSVRAEVDVAAAMLTIAVEPVVTADGQLVGLVGSVLAQSGRARPEVSPDREARGHRVRGPRVFSRLR